MCKKQQNKKKVVARVVDFVTKCPIGIFVKFSSRILRARAITY